MTDEPAESAGPPGAPPEPDRSDESTEVDDAAGSAESAAPADPDEPAGEPLDERPGGPDEPLDVPDEPGSAGPEPADEVPPVRRGRFSPTKLVVALLLALLGFTFAVQVRSVADDPAAAALGEEDLVRILANLDAYEERVRDDIAELEETRRRLSNADQSQQEALTEARRRADELGILAGTLPAAGPGITVTLLGDPAAVPAAALLDAVQELRSAGAEAMQVTGAQGPPVRVVAGSYFVDGEGGVVVDGTLLTAPYTLVAIGEPATLAPALSIPGGVVESVQQDGGTVTVQEEPGGVEVSAVAEPPALEHARPDS